MRWPWKSFWTLMTSFWCLGHHHRPALGTSVGAFAYAPVATNPRSRCQVLGNELHSTRHFSPCLLYHAVTDGPRSSSSLLWALSMDHTVFLWRLEPESVVVACSHIMIYNNDILYDTVLCYLYIAYHTHFALFPFLTLLFLWANSTDPRTCVEEIWVSFGAWTREGWCSSHRHRAMDGNSPIKVFT